MSPNRKLIDYYCPICSSDNHCVLYPDTIGDKIPPFNYDFNPTHNLTYRVVKCKECGHAYSSPRPENLYLYYQDVVDTEYLKNQEQRIKTAKKVIARIRNFAKSGRLLDVGCATGDFISVAQKYYEVEGLELSKWAVEIARKKGFNIHQCRLNEICQNFPFDIITLWGVIEHFEFPNKEVLNISNILNPGGLVSLWTGDLESITANLLGRKWWYFQGQHIQMFSQRSLDRLFADCGFKKIFLEKYPYVMTMCSIAKSLCRYPVIGKLASNILTTSWIAHKTITIKLPGEIFAIYKKTKDIS